MERPRTATKSRACVLVEHVFAVVKRLMGFTKVRYRGLQKNATRAFTALALANIYARGRLQGQVRPWISQGSRNRPCQSTVSLRAIWHSNGCAMDMTLLVQHCLCSKSKTARSFTSH